MLSFDSKPYNFFENYSEFHSNNSVVSDSSSNLTEKDDKQVKYLKFSPKVAVQIVERENPTVTKNSEDNTYNSGFTAKLTNITSHSASNSYFLVIETSLFSYRNVSHFSNDGDIGIDGETNELLTSQEINETVTVTPNTITVDTVENTKMEKMKNIIIDKEDQNQLIETKQGDSMPAWLQNELDQTNIPVDVAPVSGPNKNSTSKSTLKLPVFDQNRQLSKSSSRSPARSPARSPRSPKLPNSSRKSSIENIKNTQNIAKTDQEKNNPPTEQKENQEMTNLKSKLEAMNTELETYKKNKRQIEQLRQELLDQKQQNQIMQDVVQHLMEQRNNDNNNKNSKNSKNSKNKSKNTSNSHFSNHNFYNHSAENFDKHFDYKNWRFKKSVGSSSQSNLSSYSESSSNKNNNNKSVTFAKNTNNHNYRNSIQSDIKFANHKNRVLLNHYESKERQRAINHQKQLQQGSSNFQKSYSTRRPDNRDRRGRKYDSLEINSANLSDGKIDSKMCSLM